MKNPDASANGPGPAQRNAPGDPLSPESVPLFDIDDDDDPSSGRGASRPAAENLPPRPKSWCNQCGVKHASGDCPGEVLAREPERHGWKVVVETPTGKKVHGVLLAPAGDGWRARIMTYPRTLWVVPGGIRTMKFLAPDPNQAERQAIDFVTEHCAERNHESVDDPALKADPEPIELEQTDMVDEIEATRRKSRSVLVRFGPEKPDRKSNTADLSAKGMFIATSEPYARGTNLRILLELAGARIPLRGVVQWTRASPVPGRPGGMGIELIRPPTFYTQYLRSLP